MVDSGYKKAALFCLLIALVVFIGGHWSPADTPSLETAPDKRDVELPKFSNPAIIIAHGTIDAGLQYSVRRRVEEALADGADLILFDVNSDGGLLDEALQTARYVAGLDVTTVAYVSGHALSAAALFSVSCNYIVVKRNTIIGDSAPIIPTQEGSFEVAGEKIQSPIRAAFRNYARQNGYPELLAEAMVTEEYQVYRITRADNPERRYIRDVDWDAMPEETKEQWRTPPEVIVREGELLTMDDAEALDYGFAIARVDSRTEALALFSDAPEPTEMHPNWSEQMVRFLNNPGVSGLIMLVGFLSLYMALRTPGMGIPEGVAATCFALLFFSRYMVGLADTLDVALIVAGLALLAVEVFVLPGFGVAGLLGILSFGAGLVLMSQRFIIPRVPGEIDLLMSNMLSVLASLILSLIGFFVLMRFLPGVPVLGKMVLSSSQKVGLGYTVGDDRRRALVGRMGVTLTPLRPAGRVELDGEILDVVAEGEFVGSGEKVKVIDVRGNRVLVARSE